MLQQNIYLKRLNLYGKIFDSGFDKMEGVADRKLCSLRTISSAYDTAYYWTSGNLLAEVDFIIQCKQEIVPIEVKAEKNVKARSLAEYIKKYKPKYSVKTSMLPLVSENEFLNIPLYIISSVRKFLN